MTKTKTITSPRNQRDAADQLAAAIAVSQQEACVLPQQHPSRPKRERRAAKPLTYPADQTHSSKTEMARDKKNVERYFERMQKKQQLAAEEDGPAACAAPPVEVEPTPAEEPKAKKQARPSKRTEVEPTPAAPEEPKAKKQARPSKRTEVEPTPAAPEEPKAKKQARPSKRTSEIAETPAEVPEPVLFAEVVCSEVMTMAQKVSGKRGDGPPSVRFMTNNIVHHRSSGSRESWRSIRRCRWSMWSTRLRRCCTGTSRSSTPRRSECASSACRRDCSHLV